jgi:hypothetical protein
VLEADCIRKGTNNKEKSCLDVVNKGSTEHFFLLRKEIFGYLLQKV